MSASIIVAFITGVLGPLLILLVRYLLDRRKVKADMLTDALETSERVLAKIDIIKEKYEADRVWITQFHNGGHFYPTGKSIAKLSMIYEVVAPQVTSPLRHPSDIQNALDLIINSKSDSLFSAVEIEDFFIWENNNNIYESKNYNYC